MQHLKAKQTLLSLAVASACAALAVPACAQETGGADLSPAGGELQTVVVTGLRASLAS